MAEVKNSMGLWMALTLLGVAAVVAVLYLAQQVLLPFALAILLTFLLSPLVSRLRRWGLGRIPAVMVVVTLAFALIVGVAWFVTNQLVALAGELPKYERTMIEKVRTLRGLVKESPGGVTETIRDVQEELENPQPEEFTRRARPRRGQTDDAVPVRVVEINTEPAIVAALRDWLGPLLSPLGTAALVVIFVVFMLVYREDLRDRLLRLAGTGHIYLTTQALDEAGTRVSRYILMQVVINGTYGLAVAVGLFLLGLPNALLWGFLAAVVRFVPYVGPWIGAVLPIALALVVFEGWTRPLLVVGLFILLELVSNNVMEPWLYGQSTGLSPVGIIVAATFWTWLWGPVGLVLSTPLTVCLVVLGRHVPQLNFLNVLLSDQPALELNVRFYQRLLAFDDQEADDLAQAFLRTGTLDDLYEQMVLPALSLLERDRNEGHLTRQQQRFIHRVIQDLIAYLRRDYDMIAAAQAVPEGAAVELAADQPAETETMQQALRILCLPAEDTSDRIAGSIVTQLLAARGHEAETAQVRVVSTEAAALVDRKKIDCVVISAVAPGGAIPARKGCRLLRSRFPDLRIVVGLWNARGPIEPTTERLEASGADFVTTSLSEGIEQMQQYAKPVQAVEEAAGKP